MEKKIYALGAYLWHFKGYFVKRVFYDDNKTQWMVYKKYKDGECKDFIFTAPTLKQMTDAVAILTEDIYTPIVPEMAPTNEP
jgi:hypothetical protein